MYLTSKDDSTKWHQLPSIQERFRYRLRDISQSGNKIHHGRSIVIKNLQDWNLLFKNEEKFNSKLTIYRSFYNLIPFECKVTIMLEHNYRPGIHLAILLIYTNPHRQFYDGHIVQIEFGEKSHTHQNIERLFDLKKSSTQVVQMSENDILMFLADDDEVSDLIYGCFINRFNPIRFSHIGQDYFVDEFADNVHLEHECCHNEIYEYLIQDKIPIADYYARLNLQIQQNEPHISSYWNLNLNYLDWHRKN
jgi:hypothetical protein